MDLRKKLGAKAVAKSAKQANDETAQNEQLQKILKSKQAQLSQSERNGDIDLPKSGKYDDFRDAYTPGSDLVYGFREPREKYIVEALGTGATSWHTAPTADARNRWLVPETDKLAKEALPPHVIKYHGFFSAHPVAKYNDLSKREVLEEEQRFKKLVHACKGMIEATATFKGKIHFILDDGSVPWNMEAVVKEDPANKAASLVTARELRYIYKYRDKVLPDGSKLGDHVVFWKEGKKVDPPWVSQPELWNENFQAMKQRSHATKK